MFLLEEWYSCMVTVLPDEAQVPIQVLHVVHKAEGGEEYRAHHQHQHQ